ncbi:MAG: hypothetical protein CM15mP96_1720 [Gammaproteobacteria bacterium]|nr:MAG: hypothetical protein CM15mP96_1720 [Gammaproteobacteria bacterium]
MGKKNAFLGSRFPSKLHHSVSAFGDVDATNPTDQARTRVEDKITIEQLETDIAAGGAGATGLMCIRECLDASNIDTAIAAAFTAIENSTAPGALNVTPYKNVGDWWTEDVYYDTNGNDIQDVEKIPLLKETTTILAVSQFQVLLHIQLHLMEV